MAKRLPKTSLEKIRRRFAKPRSSVSWSLRIPGSCPDLLEGGPLFSGSPGQIGQICWEEITKTQLLNCVGSQSYLIFFVLAMSSTAYTYDFFCYTSERNCYSVSGSTSFILFLNTEILVVNVTMASWKLPNVHEKLLDNRGHTWVIFQLRGICLTMGYPTIPSTG